MGEDERFWELLDRWEDLYQQGRAPTVEQLCRDCPDLVQRVREWVVALEATDWLCQPLESDVAPRPRSTKSTPVDLPSPLRKFEGASAGGRDLSGSAIIAGGTDDTDDTDSHTWSEEDKRHLAIGTAAALLAAAALLVGLWVLSGW